MATNISRLTIHASSAKVWKALTNPEWVAKWQYGSELATDWKEGNSIRFKTAWEGKIFEQWGTVREFNPYEKISYSLFAPRPDLEDKPENYFIMSYVLTAVNGHTQLEIIQEDNRPHAVQEEPQGEENPMLRMLKELVEA
jgi:uncharacterized protein YndB with AHSA1/START domain